MCPNPFFKDKHGIFNNAYLYEKKILRSISRSFTFILFFIFIIININIIIHILFSFFFFVRFLSQNAPGPCIRKCGWRWGKKEIINFFVAELWGVQKGKCMGGTYWKGKKIVLWGLECPTVYSIFPLFAPAQSAQRHFIFLKNRLCG